MKSRKKIFMGIGSVLLLAFVGVFIFTLLGGNPGMLGKSTNDTAEYAPGYPAEAPAEESLYLEKISVEEMRTAAV